MSLRIGICFKVVTNKTAYMLPSLQKDTQKKKWIFSTRMPNVPAKVCFRMSRSAP